MARMKREEWYKIARDVDGLGPQVEIIDRTPKYKKREAPVFNPAVAYLLPDEICDDNNLPRGSRTDKDTFNNLTTKLLHTQIVEGQRQMAERAAEMDRLQARIDALRADVTAAPPAREPNGEKK